MEYGNHYSYNNSSNTSTPPFVNPSRQQSAYGNQYSMENHRHSSPPHGHQHSSNHAYYNNNGQAFTNAPAWNNTPSNTQYRYSPTPVYTPPTPFQHGVLIPQTLDNAPAWKSQTYSAPATTSMPVDTGPRQSHATNTGHRPRPYDNGANVGQATNVLTTSSSELDTIATTIPKSCSNDTNLGFSNPVRDEESAQQSLDNKEGVLPSSQYSMDANSPTSTQSVLSQMRFEASELNQQPPTKRVRIFEEHLQDDLQPFREYSAETTINEGESLSQSEVRTASTPIAQIGPEEVAVSSKVTTKQCAEIKEYKMRSADLENQLTLVQTQVKELQKRARGLKAEKKGVDAYVQKLQAEAWEKSQKREKENPGEVEIKQEE